MAKKGNRILIALTCDVCKKDHGVTRRNYLTKRNTINTTEKLAMKKYCPVCRASTLHSEGKVPKTINRQ
jgi:large subunit ribosomal protein L33